MSWCDLDLTFHLDVVTFSLKILFVHVNNFSSKTTRPRDMLFVLKDTLSIEYEKLFKGCQYVCLFPRAITGAMSPPKV